MAISNVGSKASYPILIDTIAPTLTISSTGGVTNQTTQIISGTIDPADAGLTISIYDGSTLLGTTTADGTGAWSKALTLLSTEGSHSITATATDAAGNLGISSAVVYNLDNVPPILLDADISNDGNLITNSQFVTYYIKFSEPVTGVDYNSFELDVSDSDISTKIVSLTGSGTDYKIIIDTGSISEGRTIKLGLIGNSIFDLNGNIYGGGFIQPQKKFDVGTYVGGIVSIDLNNDGNADYATGNGGNDTVTTFIGDGNGNFTLNQTINVQYNPGPIISADINIDGYKDLVVANRWNNSVSVLLNNKYSNFSKPINYLVGNNVQYINIDYVNSDNYLDILTANQNDNTVSILYGNGKGEFDNQIIYSIGNGPSCVYLSDINNDNKKDLIIGNFYSNYINILYGEGNGKFNNLQSLIVESSPYKLITSDINLDGNIDIITSNLNDNSVTVLMGNGDGTFKSNINYSVDKGPYAISVNDVNRDGKIDIITANFNSSTVSILLGNGDGTFQFSKNYEVGLLPDGLSLIDVNNDGRIDILTSNNTGYDVSLLINNSNIIYGKIYTIDKQAPLITINTLINNGLTNTSIQTISGSVGIADAGLTISIYDGTTLLDTTTADGTGAWSKAVTLPSVQGSHSITAKATDAAGNLGTSSAVVYNLDTLAPTLAITSIGGSTYLTYQTISGTVGIADAGLTISIYDGTTLLGTTTADDTGAWSKTVTLLSTQGEQSITAKATDAAGNVGISNAVVYSPILNQSCDVSADTSSANEGSNATFTLVSFLVSSFIYPNPGTVFHYTISGTVNGSDIVGGVMSGNVIVYFSGKATITIPIAADNLTEGPETLTVTVDGSSASMTVNDTSNVNTSNVILGSAGNTPIMGTARDDVITANSGTKTIDGGAGTNTVVFEGTQTQYRIGVGSNGTLVVKGPNVSDTLTNIQQLQFGSGPITSPAASKTDDLLKSCYYDSNKNLITSYVLPNLNTDPNVSVKYAQIADQSLIQTNVLDANGCSDSFFLKGGPATDAISGGTGNDIVDGGTGSNFLTGSGGWDTFFIDGRGGQFTWGTITDYTGAQGIYYGGPITDITANAQISPIISIPAEQVSIWGWNPGVSRMAWDSSNGAAGYQGATLKLDFDNNGTFDAYVTFTGLTQSQLPTPVEFTPAQTSGNGLLWFK